MEKKQDNSKLEPNSPMSLKAQTGSDPGKPQGWNCWCPSHDCLNFPEPPLSAANRESLRMLLHIAPPTNPCYYIIIAAQDLCVNCWQTNAHGAASFPKPALTIWQREVVRVKMEALASDYWMEELWNAGLQGIAFVTAKERFPAMGFRGMVTSKLMKRNLVMWIEEKRTARTPVGMEKESNFTGCGNSSWNAGNKTTCETHKPSSIMQRGNGIDNQVEQTPPHMKWAMRAAKPVGGHNGRPNNNASSIPSKITEARESNDPDDEILHFKLVAYPDVKAHDSVDSDDVVLHFRPNALPKNEPILPILSSSSLPPYQVTKTTTSKHDTPLQVSSTAQQPSTSITTDTTTVLQEFQKLRDEMAGNFVRFTMQMEKLVTAGKNPETENKGIREVGQQQAFAAVFKEAKNQFLSKEATVGRNCMAMSGQH